MIPKIDFWLDLLYYKIGRQMTDFDLQQQQQDGFMSKRRKYSEIGFAKDPYWLSRVNARTLLVNEVVLDLDPLPGQGEKEMAERFEAVGKELSRYKPEYWGYFKSNRGYHLHLFFKEFFKMSENQRIQARKVVIDRFGADMLKAHERTTIALEFSQHWKSGKKKEMTEWNMGTETNY